MAPVSQSQATKAKVVNMRSSIRTTWKSLKQRYRLDLLTSFRARHPFVLCHPITAYTIEPVATSRPVV
jgi:hypothetical protein